MVTFFTYSLGVSVTLLILWFSYRMALHGDRRFNVNRAVILSIYAASILTLPLLNLLKKTVPASLPSVRIFPVIIHHDTLASISGTIDTLATIWAAGALIVLIAVSVEVFRILMLIHRSERIRLKDTVVYITDSDRISPFSIGNTIVMSRKDFDNSRDMIITHEKGHIFYRHTLDMIAAQFFTIICWYNPAAWLMRSELKTIHEFQADSFTLRIGTDIHDYQMFLIGHAAGSQFPAIANGLNRSNLKKRILMMHRNGNKKFRTILYAVPIIGLLAAITVLCIPQVRIILNSDRIVSAEEKQADSIPAVYVNDKEIPRDRLNEFSPDNIKSITINKQADRIDIETR